MNVGLVSLIIAWMFTPAMAADAHSFTATYQSEKR